MTQEVATTVDQEYLIEVLENMKTLKEQLESVGDRSYKITDKFKWTPATNAPRIDIQEEHDVQQLLHVLAFLKTRHDSYNDAAKLAGITTYPVCKWLGHSIKDWQDDVCLRLTILSQNTSLKSLEEDMAIVEKSIDPAITQKRKLDSITNKYSTSKK